MAAKKKNLKEAVKSGAMKPVEALAIMRKRKTWSQAKNSKTAQWFRNR